MKLQLLFSGVELDPRDADYSLDGLDGTYIYKLIEKANQCGLEGVRVRAIEVRENFATMSKYVDFIVDNTELTPTPITNEDNLK